MVVYRAFHPIHAILIATVLLALSACGPLAAEPEGTELAPAGLTGGRLWPTAGHDLSNTRNAKTERRIGPDNVADLAPRWVTATGGDVSATPAVDGSSVYVPDWAGNLYRLDRDTGAVIWSWTIDRYTGVLGDLSRTTPAIHDGMLILGNQGGGLGLPGAIVFAVDKTTGAPIWTTWVDEHPAAIITQSAVVFGGMVFVGVSSREEEFAYDPDYACCNFRASMVALDVATGAIVWSTSMAPEGYSGNAIWGSTPVVDPKRRSVYVTTGNNYSVPPSVLECVTTAGDNAQAIEECVRPDNLFDSIVALDLDTGALRWATRTLPYDAWTVACSLGSGAPNCPDPAGPNFDFGQGAMLFRASQGRGKPRELLGAGQKSGQFWALDPDTGSVVWVTQAGPGGALGGLQWGSAVDGERIYVANANTDAASLPLPDGSTTTRGVWSALDTATGAILWQTADPLVDVNHAVTRATLQGPVTVANGVVYGCSVDDAGPMYALDAATGAVLWSFQSGGSCISGAAVVDGTVYWGSGYTNLSGFLGATGNDKVYAFDLGD